MRYTYDQRVRAVKLLQTNGLKYIEQVVATFQCCLRIVWQWWTNSKQGEDIIQLQNKSFVPKTKHPHAHTDDERLAIESVVLQYPNTPIIELYGQLRLYFGYTRSYSTFHDYFTRHYTTPKSVLAPYIPKPYDTPKMLGQKWQMDVKCVPSFCPQRQCKGNKFYQYSMIDETTRQRFIFPYKEQTTYSTQQFIKSAINYFGYKPIQIQTDNGTEFVNDHNLKHKNGTTKLSYPEQLCQQLDIDFKQIRPATPRLNGKVERYHREDQKWYTHLRFDSYQELQDKMLLHLKLTNEAPSRALGWKSKIDKRNNLTKLLIEKLRPMSPIKKNSAETHLTTCIKLYTEHFGTK
jgi:hypothetical protein